MHYSQLDYEEILKKLKPHLIKDQFQLLKKLDEILRGRINGHNIRDVARILAELDEDVKKALSNDAISNLVSVQPMTAPIGRIFALEYLTKDGTQHGK